MLAVTPFFLQSTVYVESTSASCADVYKSREQASIFLVQDSLSGILPETHDFEYKNFFQCKKNRDVSHSRHIQHSYPDVWVSVSSFDITL